LLAAAHRKRTNAVSSATDRCRVEDMRDDRDTCAGLTTDHTQQQ